MKMAEKIERIFETPLAEVQINREDHINELLDNIAEYQSKARQNVDIQNLKDANFEKMTEIKARKMDEIRSERDKETNKLKYTNDDTREAAQFIALQEDMDYQDAKKEQNRLNTEYQHNQIEMDMLQQLNSIWKRDFDLLIASVKYGAGGD